MPNHTANNFTITGPKDDVLRFVAQAKGTDSELDFNKILPIPEELRGTNSPAHVVSQEAIDKTWADWNKRKTEGNLGDFEKERPFNLGITQAKYDELVAKYGCADWYDWSIRNWGTKWNAYDVTEWSINECSEYTASATIYYETAWRVNGGRYHIGCVGRLEWVVVVVG